MLRILRTLAIVLVIAALCAAAVRIFVSGDPAYSLKEWIYGARYARYDGMLAAAGRKHSVDPMLLKAITWRESAFDPHKVGTSGERGLMQVGEAAAQDWAKSAKIETFAPTDLFDPKTNLDAGSWYFHKALEHWKTKEDPIPFALAEYNAGRTRVERWIARTNRNGDASAADLLAAMDYPSTKQYIEDITARYRFYQKRGRL